MTWLLALRPKDSGEIREARDVFYKAIETREQSTGKPVSPY